MTVLKKNHHYVPQFWLRGFADSNGQIYAWDGQKVRTAASNKIMQSDWLYTLFDNAWQPSNALEDELARIEGIVAPLFVNLSAPTASPTATDRQKICDFLALQACRHPDIMKRGHRRARELGALIAGAHAFQSVNDFVTEAAKFAIPASVAHALHGYLCAQDPAQLRQELDELNRLSAQDAQLPEQEAVRAQAQIAQAIATMLITLLDVPNGSAFVLGDTPMPQENLGHGFSVALSKSVAIDARPSTAVQSTIGRRVATIAEISAANQAQWDNSLHIVIGSDPQALRILK